MQASIQHALIIGLAIATAVILVVAWGAIRRAESKGYDLGYNDAKKGHSSHIEALHEDIALKRLQLRQADAAHQLDREQLLQDCDNRIAHYSRRANPFTEEDAAGLMKSAGQLLRANELFEHLGATTEADYAFSASNHVTLMAARIREAIAEANKPTEQHLAEGAAA
ncbi:hypothetical protein V2A28_05880 [Pseudomonas aeruginosa]|uniref:hypothetical protein n=1 Tax=Pseudomonas aeruginosa group TaxID=136841 RepID=UPI00070E8DFF|nr:MULTISPECIES: hypothetical protein [Pseudomonas aeruginosa group]MDG9855629.1 hypothetical protein [Pseudomonas nitroreducens]